MPSQSWNKKRHDHPSVHHAWHLRKGGSKERKEEGRTLISKRWGYFNTKSCSARSTGLFQQDSHGDHYVNRSKTHFKNIKIYWDHPQRISPTIVFLWMLMLYNVILISVIVNVYGIIMKSSLLRTRSSFRTTECRFTNSYNKKTLKGKYINSHF